MMKYTHTPKLKRRWLSLPGLILLAAGLICFVGVGDSSMPEPFVADALKILPSPTPTATPTPGWWHKTDSATPTLKKLPGVPRPKFKNGANGTAEPGMKVPFSVISCPTGGVEITDIRTASGPWWHISGTASIPNLWYWKAEISVDGEHWASLYRSEAAVVNGLLVRLNLTTIPTNTRLIRLTAVDQTGNYPEPCLIGTGR